MSFVTPSIQMCKLLEDLSLLNVRPSVLTKCHPIHTARPCPTEELRLREGRRGEAAPAVTSCRDRGPAGNGPGECRGSCEHNSARKVQGADHHLEKPPWAQSSSDTSISPAVKHRTRLDCLLPSYLSNSDPKCRLCGPLRPSPCET